jgi:hypothetical protein
MKRYGVPTESTMPGTRRNFGIDVDITGSADERRARAGENPPVHSKSTRHGHPASRFASDPRQPRTSADGVYRDEVNGDVPITHHNEVFTPHVETVGHPGDGAPYIHPTFPNAEAKATKAVHTHEPLRPVGQTWDKYGGEHGEKPRRPESGNRGATTETFARGALDKDPMANRK